MEVSLWVVRTICLPTPPSWGHMGEVSMVLLVVFNIYSLNLSPPSTTCADVEQRCRGWREQAEGRPQALLGCAPGAAWEGISPDFPGASEVGESLSGAAGGPGEAQKLDYFCNTEHICSQPQRRSISGRRAGMCGPGGGESCGFPISGSLEGLAVCALWGRWGCLQLSPWTREVAMM